MTEQTNTRIPAPLYAAAGAGDLAYQQLRKLPSVVNELNNRVNELSERAAASLKSANDQAGTKAATLRDKAGSTDFDKLRDTATSNAVAFAQVASERAIALYTALVARGERVVGTGVVEAADVVNADIETTVEPKAIATTTAAVTTEAVVTPEVIATAETTTAAEAAARKRATKAAPAKTTAPKNQAK